MEPEGKRIRFGIVRDMKTLKRTRFFFRCYDYGVRPISGVVVVKYPAVHDDIRRAAVLKVLHQVEDDEKRAELRKEWMKVPMAFEEIVAKVKRTYYFKSDEPPKMKT